MTRFVTSIATVIWATPLVALIRYHVGYSIGCIGPLPCTIQYNPSEMLTEWTGENVRRTIAAGLPRIAIQPPPPRLNQYHHGNE
jgi:hypothetical protein